MELQGNNGWEIPRAFVGAGEVFFCITCGHWHWTFDELLDVPGCCDECLREPEHLEPALV